MFDLVGTSEAVIGTQDPQLAERVQELMAGEFLRINTSEDVVGVEICGALKNVLAIAAGIVDGMDLGRNAQAAVVVQGCAEIRWLAERMGAHPRTVSGLSGLGDIMLTCYGDLSRNRSVGLRLGAGESIDDIIASSSQVGYGYSIMLCTPVVHSDCESVYSAVLSDLNDRDSLCAWLRTPPPLAQQVAEGVATAGVVVMLARKYRVQLPVLTAVAQVLGNELGPKEAVEEIMQLPQVAER